MDTNSERIDNSIDNKLVLVKKIEDAYKLYKLSELFLNDVHDDYGKFKIARLRFDFARHQLLTLIGEARGEGITLSNNEIVNTFYHTDL